MPAVTQRATLAVDCRCILGEGLTWDARRGVWFWTDIESSVLWMHRPDDGATRTWRLPERLGCLAVAKSGRLILGLATRVAIADPDASTGEDLALRTLAGVETDVPETRVNDGRADRAGNFVFGSYNERSDAPLGSFYQFSAAHGLRRIGLPRVAIANSICFSPDGEVMYFCDSATRRIMRGRYDAPRAAVSGVEVFVALPDAVPMPDGSIVDADGALWNAEWGGACVRRYDHNGALTHTLELPEPFVTCPGLGGAELADLFVTTARGRPDPAAGGLETAGALYRATEPMTTRGLADTLFDDAGLRP